ncbi:hypothetical protein B0H21DRAFT_739349 [Amylocystis lapponica]|nr:hypothetical protein B0H21DRAFT_739349 [Amylocystis lapponica]
MGQTFDEIPQYLVDWIMRQEMFFVATAPQRTDGHVNVSPKGLRGTFHIDDAHRVWYEDLSGSGSETMAHLRENGRITIMFSAFEGAPRILRLWGTGTAHEFGTPEYDALVPPTTRLPGSRCAVVVAVHRVGLSCGYGVPQYTFKAHRSTLVQWLAGLERSDQAFAAAATGGDDAVRSEQGMKAYWAHNNVRSIDDAPAMLTAHVSRKTPMHTLRSAEENGFLIKDSGQDSEKARAGGGSAVGVVLNGVRSAEVGRLVAAFSLGLAVAAVYVKGVGVPCV